MTREEAIQTINNYYPSSSKGEYEDLRNALNVAIRSLEVWDKVIEEIDDIDVLLFDDRYEVKEECKYIIKKYLKEVEDEQIH